jgi:hypothetical protein
LGSNRSEHERVGFRRIPPFGEYQEDPLSWSYEKRLCQIIHVLLLQRTSESARR